MTLRARIVQVDVPAAQLGRAVDFWSRALSAEPVDAPGAYTHLVGATSALEVHVQALEHAEHPSYHLDLEADDRDGEAARLIAAGATELARFDRDGYTVLADPAGLPFCLIDADAAEPTPVAPRRLDRGYLAQVLLDVPADQVDRTVRFWCETLHVGPAAVVTSGPYRLLPGIVGPGGPVLLAVQALGADEAARVHVDLNAADVAQELDRLVGLGAQVVGPVDDWIILRDPVEGLLCVIPRGDAPDGLASSAGHPTVPVRGPR